MSSTTLLKLKAALLAFLLGFAAPASMAQTTDIVDFRASQEGARARLVFELTGPASHKLFTLKSPERVVIDIENVTLSARLPSNVDGVNVLKRIRNAPRNGRDLRVVLDLDATAQPKSFLLKPDGDSRHRLVIDLFETKRSSPVTTVKTISQSEHLRDVIIAIDAGHGGRDPGAIGHRGTYEKHIALVIARELAKLVNKERGMKAILIRDGDYYIGLRERIEKARAHKADLFISIHADAFHKRDAHGSSVFALSLSGASSEAAQWLANRENASELIGGVSLDDKDDIVASVLLDLSQTATIQSSLDVGGEVLNELGNLNTLHRNQVQQAGFMVLKSPDIPSLLIETAFISNPEEERKLLDKKYQAKMVDAILRGVQRYFVRKAPPGTLIAEKNGKLRDGDKLSAVALD